MRLNGLGRTFDENGNLLGDAAPVNIDDTFGGKMWRFFHSGQERTEYKDSGVEPPPETTIGDVYEAGARDLRETASTVYTESRSLMQWLVIGAVAVAVIYIADKLPSQGNVRRYANRKVRGARRALARHIAGE